MAEQAHCCVPQKKWYDGRLFRASVIFLLVTLAASFSQAYGGVLDGLLHYLHIIAIPIGAGLLIGGLIDTFLPESYVTKYLSYTRKRTLLLAVGLGFLMSACCHGILAIAMELYKKGASTASVVAFLLASPWANLPFTILLFGFFGWKAAYFVLSAILIALITGWLFQVFEKLGWVESNPVTADAAELDVLKDIKERFSQYSWTPQALKDESKSVMLGTLRVANMVVWWILIGVCAAAWIRVLVSNEFFVTYLNSDIKGILGTLFLATILEVCSEGTAPLSFELFHQTGAFGNVLVFLMAGVATDYTEIGLIWTNIGRRSAILLPLITVPQILLLGFLFNHFL